MRRFLIFFFAIFFVAIGATWIWVAARPMAFLDREYPMWKAKMDMEVNLPPGSVVILGDSRAMADLIPARIGTDVFNLAVGGGSSIEACVIARTVLSSPNPPRALIFSISAGQCVMNWTFWDRAVKFGLADRETIGEIRKRSLELGDHASLFGPHTICDVDARLKTDLYSMRFPSFYFSSLIEGGVFQRESGNLKIQREVMDARGHHLFGVNNGCRKLCSETRMPAFTPSPLLDSYMAETVALFQKKNIPVFFIVTPWNEASMPALHGGFTAAYKAYIDSYEKRFSNFRRLGDPLPVFPWTDFGDTDHLNAQGSARFSDSVAKLVLEAGIEKPASR